MEGFEWVAEMRDGMSKPAKDAKASLAQLRAEMRSVDAELLKMNRDQQAMSRKMGPLSESGQLKADMQAMRAKRQEMALMQRQLQDVGGAGQEMSVTVGGGLLSMLGPLATVYGSAMLIVGSFKAAASAAYDFIVEGSKMAIVASETREHSMRMFTGLAGGNETIGGATYAMVQGLRREIPQSEKEIRSWTATLMGAGLTDPGKLKETMKAMASSSALMGGGDQGNEAAEKIKTLIARAQETGSFKVKGGLKAFVGTGISGDDLQKALGMTEAQLNTAFTKGTIPAEKGMKAITDILSTKGAEALRGTMSEWDVIIDKGKESISHLFDDIPGVGEFMRSVKEIGKLFDWDTVEGQALKELLRSVFGETLKDGSTFLHQMKIEFIWMEVYALRLKHALAPLKPMFDAIGDVIMWQIADALKRAESIINAITHGLHAIDSFMPGDETPGVRQPKGFERAPGHASGGMVLPAQGEMFASVAPGEMILPADISRAMSAPQLGGSDGGDGANLSQHNDFHFHGVKDAEDAKELMVDALADVLERAALECGR